MRLRARQSHGTHAKYNSGCRCADCKAGHASYCLRRKQDRKAGDANGVVDATEAREHIRRLARAGVGYRAVADSTDLTHRIVLGIKTGKRTNIRARSLRKILKVSIDCRGDNALVSGASTWRRIEKLLEEGFSKADLARQLGYVMPALQIRRQRVTVRTRARIERLFEKLTT